jgi:hypothetical protein
MKNLIIKSDHYGTYEAEYLCSINYYESVVKAGEIIDLYKKYFGKTFFSKWINPWPDNYPDAIKNTFPGMIEELYYPTEKSAPGHPLCDDKSVKKFLEQIKQYR